MMQASACGCGHAAPVRPPRAGDDILERAGVIQSAHARAPRDAAAMMQQHDAREPLRSAR